MRKILFVLFLMIPVSAMAQGRLKAGDHGPKGGRMAWAYDGEKTVLREVSQSAFYDIYPDGKPWNPPQKSRRKYRAQDAPQATAKPSATPAPSLADSTKTDLAAGTIRIPEEKKPKPVIVEKDALLLLSNLELRMENARLKAEAAIPQSVKDEMKAIGTELDKFWAERGIKREELATKWTGSQGVNGAIILTPTEPKPLPAAPEKK